MDEFSQECLARLSSNIDGLQDDPGEVNGGSSTATHFLVQTHRHMKNLAVFTTGLTVGRLTALGPISILVTAGNIIALAAASPLAAAVFAAVAGTAGLLYHLGREDKRKAAFLDKRRREAEEYAELKKHGLNGVICFQETYNKARYNVYHPRGMKSKFEWRVNGFDRMGQAGVHSIGMGVLIGLEEWRTDVTMMAYHLRYLQKKYWKTKYSVNFPRMRPAENGGFQPNVIMNDRELAQLTFAMRIFDHDVDISYSTREPAHIRDNMAGLGVTTMSAESKTEPGGYYTYPQALEQFHVSDERTAVEVERALKSLGREPVWKDWDASFDQFASTR